MFFEDFGLFFEFLILRDEVFEFVLVDGEVCITFRRDKLLFELLILFSQLFDSFI